MSVYCADLVKELNDQYYNNPPDWEIQEIRKNKKYRLPGADGWVNEKIVAAVMKHAVQAMKLQRDLVKAKDYAKQWVDLYWMGRKKENASVADYYEMFKTWDEIDDGRPVDSKWLEEQRANLKNIKREEAAQNQKRTAEERRRRMEEEAERIREAKEELRRQRQSAQREQLRREYEEKRAGLDRAERALNFALDDCLYTNQENYVAGNLSAGGYAMRDFVRDDFERKYRREYDDALAMLEAEDDEDDW